MDGVVERVEVARGGTPSSWTLLITVGGLSGPLDPILPLLSLPGWTLQAPPSPPLAGRSHLCYSSGTFVGGRTEAGALADRVRSDLTEALELGV